MNLKGLGIALAAIAGAVAPVAVSRIIDPALLDLYIKSKSGKLDAMDYYINGAVQLEDLDTGCKFVIFADGNPVIIKPSGEARTMNKIERILLGKVKSMSAGRAVGYMVDQIKKQVEAQEQERTKQGEGILTTMTPTRYEA